MKSLPSPRDERHEVAESDSATSAPSDRRRRKRARGVAATGLALAMIAGGGFLILRGPTHHEPPGEEMPSKPFVNAHPVASGPDWATINGQRITSHNMGANHVFVPQLGVNASLVNERFRGGELEIPEDPAKVGRDVGSPALNSKMGTTLLAGHVRFNTTPGALKHLAQLHPGARIYVSDARGHAYGFLTSSLASYVKRELPKEVFARTGSRQVALVTCGGPIVRINGVRHFRDNVVAMAVPLQP